MTRKEAREGLLQCLKEPLASRGFALIKTKTIFRKAGDDFTDIISFAILDRPNGATEFRPQAVLLAEKIEAMISEGKSKDAVTLGADIGRIAGDPERWETTIQSDRDIKAAAELVVQSVDEVATPFFAKFSDLRAIDEHINSKPRENAKFCRAQVLRAQVGVVVAQMLNRPNVSALKDVYREELGHMSEGYLKDFDEFLARLDQPTKLKN